MPIPQDILEALENAESLLQDATVADAKHAAAQVALDAAIDAEEEAKDKAHDAHKDANAAAAEVLATIKQHFAL